EFFVTQRPLSPHFSVIPVGKIFFSVFSILWESRNNEHRNYLGHNKVELPLVVIFFIPTDG
ncbi:MAG: hypothetical protein WAW77_13650, partial [Caldibacillus thermoamylovorans]